MWENKCRRILLFRSERISFHDFGLNKVDGKMTITGFGKCQVRKERKII